MDSIEFELAGWKTTSPYPGTIGVESQNCVGQIRLCSMDHARTLADNFKRQHQWAPNTTVLRDEYPSVGRFPERLRFVYFFNEKVLYVRLFAFSKIDDNAIFIECGPTETGTITGEEADLMMNHLVVGD